MISQSPDASAANNMPKGSTVKAIVKPGITSLTSIEGRPPSIRRGNKLQTTQIKETEVIAVASSRRLALMRPASAIACATTNGITIATNMAGRGTDIQLGGNKDFRDEDNQKELPQIKEDKEKVKLLGGLYIVGTERHESRRIDNQLRGRSGMSLIHI